jgi:hypothetical protein
MNNNSGQEWTLDEDNKLMEQVLSGLSYEQIALDHGRSYLSVSNRVYINIKRMIDDNNSREFLCAKYHVKPEDYDNFLERQKKKYENKRKKKSQPQQQPQQPQLAINQDQYQEMINLLREIRDLLQIRRNKKTKQ